MSVLTDLIYGGADAVADRAEDAVNDAIVRYGAEKVVAFPDTAYFAPAIYAATGIKVKTLEDVADCLGILRKFISHREDLSEALNAGLAAAVGAEILELLKYTDGADPYAGEAGVGFVSDAVIRSLGVPLVTGDIPGVAVVLGKADNPHDAVATVRSYQDKGLLTFLVGEIIDQAIQGDVRIGLDYRVIPLGYDITAVIHVITVAIRVALIFGAVEPGDLNALLAYTSERVLAFVNIFGEIDSAALAVGAGAIALGFPVIADVDLGDKQVPGKLISVTDHAETVPASLSLRNIRVRAKKVSLPVAFSAAYEGEIIRKNDTCTEFVYDKNPTCELVISHKNSDEVTDHKLTIVGPDLSVNDGKIVLLPLGTCVEVYGERMQDDFEAVIERRIHAWMNYVEGVMHTGQRNQIRIRVSRETVARGFRLTDMAEMLYTMIMDEFGSVVDSCQITLITDGEKVRELLEQQAFPRYAARDERLGSMTDESVDQFYTCVLCQSFAPSHCCIVTPERLGLCGAVSWLDTRTTHELNSNGPSQPIPKEGCINETTGAYTAVNDAVSKYTYGAVKQVTLYSVMEHPMTACGCFECICGIYPECNGFVIVNREYPGITPTGLTFGELASMTGGGVQTPGFMGLGRSYIPSKKFAAAEGGIRRIVWMTKELKESVGAKLNRTAKELYGIDNFTDMICDETIANDAEGVLDFLTEMGHPALEMERLM